MANVSLTSDRLLAKIGEQAAMIATLELIRDTLDEALNAANVRIAELEARVPAEVPTDASD